ncbi:DUF3898 domain-containing protein [Ectobacillus sp. sgz5001026]
MKQVAKFPASDAELKMTTDHTVIKGVLTDFGEQIHTAKVDNPVCCDD